MSWTNRLKQMFGSGDGDIFTTAIGKNLEQLSTEGKTLYPQENVASNRQGHRLAAKLMTQRYGPLMANTAGLGNELVEGLSQASSGINPFRQENIQESMGDLGANWRGTKDAMQGQLDEGTARLRAALMRAIYGQRQ